MTGWRDRALCAQVGGDLWFAENRSTESYRLAKRICARCTVTAECLTAGHQADRLDPTGEGFGVYGGLSPRERRNPRKQAAA